MPEPAVVVEGLGKRYAIGRRERYRALRDVLAEAAAAPFRGLRRSAVGPDQDHVWALRDVSFEVNPGEVLGIIGHNGAGKTTLLKILSRITEPTEGRALLRGRVGSLLEVGTGFHAELTGRENIFLNGAILGMRRAEIQRQFDAIVDFSGVERFIDTPVKRYSSGMYVRLAFAVAAHLSMEILLIDEVLAVGDAAFQEKCLGKMSQVAHSGRTILFISHNMGLVRNLCSRMLLFNMGQIQGRGTAEAVIQQYLSDLNTIGKAEQALATRSDRSGSGRARAVSFSARAIGAEGNSPQTGADAEFILQYAGSGSEPLLRLHLAIGVLDEMGNNVFGCTTSTTSQGDFRDVPPSGTVVCRLQRLPLIPGRYWVRIMLKDEHGVIDSVDKAALFEVVDGGATGFPLLPTRRWGNIVVQHSWDWSASRVPEVTVGERH